MPIWVNISQRVVPHVAIFVKCLWIEDVGVRQRPRLTDLPTREWVYDSACPFIRRGESSLRGTVIASLEVIEARFGVSFFGGEQCYYCFVTGERRWSAHHFFHGSTERCWSNPS